MKHILLFEKLNNKPKIGDCVICQDTFFSNTQPNVEIYRDFLKNNIGKIIKKDIETTFMDRFIVKYNNIPEKIADFFGKNNCSYFTKNEIVEFGKTEKELKIKLTVGKYNL